MSELSPGPGDLPAGPPVEGGPPGRQLWVDGLKAVALIWVFLNHVSELLLGSPNIGNPYDEWPPFADRLSQLQPLQGYGWWDLPVNLFRYVGWLGDQAVALFLIASGFGLAASLLKHQSSGPVRWREFYGRRLWRIYPLWWIVHIGPVIKWVAGRLPAEEKLPLLLDLTGFRAVRSTFSYYAASWWFMGLLLQLYVLFPLAWILMKKMGSLRFLVAAVVISTIARGAGMVVFRSYMDPWLRGSVFITRFPEFALGMALAQVLQDAPGRWDARLRSRAFILSAGAVYLAGTALSLTWAGMTVAPFIVGLGAVGVLYPLLNPACPGWGSKVLRWVGVHTYAIYLVHEKVVFKLIAPDAPLSLRVILLIIAAAGLSVLIGVVLEWGIRRATDLVSRRRAPQGAQSPSQAKA